MSNFLHMSKKSSNFAVQNQNAQQEVIKIAVIGLPQSGKSSLSHALQGLADAGKYGMQFVEVHHPDDLHGHIYDVVLQVVDSTRLEESLMLTPHIIDEQEKIVLAIGRYDLLLETDHSLNIPKLEQLIGVPTCRVSVRKTYGLPNCLSVSIIGCPSFP